MITAEAFGIVLLLLLAGSALHRALAVALLRINGVPVKPDGAVTERELFFLGMLPALALVGTIGIYLALLGLFRADVNAFLLLVAMAWRRRDLVATLRTLGELLRDGWHALRDLRLLTLLSIAAFFGLAVILIFNAQLPDSDIDVWVFQIPLARSLVSNSGFLFPQAAGLFYSAQPFFANLLFAEAMQYVDHFVAAHIMNISIFLAFLLGLFGSIRVWRPAALLLIVWFFGGSMMFSPNAVTALTDFPPSCFSVGAILFAYRYLRFGLAYYIIVSGFLAGAAISSKYTELITPCLIGVMLVPQLMKGRRAWFDALGFGAAALIVGVYWYAKNWILVGNPVYPLFFGHPGLSDETVAGWLKEMSQAYDPALRIYVKNLLTPQGWHDFGFVLGHWFFLSRSSWIAAILIAAGLLLRTPKLIFLAGGTAALFVTWYVAMFNTFRFAMPAYLLFFSTAMIAWSDVAVRAHAFATRGHFIELRRFVRRIAPDGLERPTKRWLDAFEFTWTIRTARLGLAVALAVVLAVFVARRGIERVIGGWVDVDYLQAVVQTGGIDTYLDARRPGYKIYRYIARNNLRTVLQPFDRAAPSYAAGYNGGQDGEWILYFNILPAAGDDIDVFLKTYQVRYFISRPPFTQEEMEYIGQPHAEIAFDLVARLIPRSRLLLTDAFGWSLYQITEAANEQSRP